MTERSSDRAGIDNTTVLGRNWSRQYFCEGRQCGHLETVLPIKRGLSEGITSSLGAAHVRQPGPLIFLSETFRAKALEYLITIVHDDVVSHVTCQRASTNHRAGCVPEFYSFI
jgi:hypothetical protein